MERQDEDEDEDDEEYKLSKLTSWDLIRIRYGCSLSRFPKKC